MDRRTYIERIGTVVAAGAVAGCTGNGGGNGTTDGDGNGDDSSGDGGETEYGVLSTSVTDQPNDIGDFESLIVTVEGIWVKPAGADEETDEDETATPEDGETTPEEEAPPEEDDADEETGDETGETDEEEQDDRTSRRYIEFGEAQEADLVQLQGGETKLVNETELEVGEYQYLQLDVSDTRGTLVDGGEAVVETPGNAPLKFNQTFEVRPEETTRFIADFAPFQRGNGEYLIRPVASGTQVLYGDAEADSEDGSATETETEDTQTATEDTPSGNSAAEQAN